MSMDDMFFFFAWWRTGCVYWPMFIFPRQFGVEILNELMKFIMDKPDVSVIVAGDFNMTMHKRLDRFPPGAPPVIILSNPLFQFCGETELVDI